MAATRCAAPASSLPSPTAPRRCRGPGSGVGAFVTASGAERAVDGFLLAMPPQADKAAPPESTPGTRVVSYRLVDLPPGDPRGLGDYLDRSFRTCAKARDDVTAGAGALVGTVPSEYGASSAQVVLMRRGTHLLWATFDGSGWRKGEQQRAAACSSPDCSERALTGGWDCRPADQRIVAGSTADREPAHSTAGVAMPIATPEVYADMLDRAKAGSFAYPAINVSSSQTLNAALKGFADAGSDGIIQVSTGGAEYLSGPSIKNMVSGSLAFAAFAHEVAKKYPVNIALHTDHCPKDKLDGFVRPLLAASTERVQSGGTPWFQSHMFDGSAVPLEENLETARELLALAKAANVVLEIEVGVVGGEEDGVAHEINDKLYSTPADAIATIQALGSGENGRYLTALTFGNVHGVYKPGNVKLRPEVLLEAQQAGARELGLSDDARPFDLVFHGGSGSLPEEISSAVDFGVVKMNVDTDTQYAFTRKIADWMISNYAGVLKVDGEVGNKKQYDPRAWGKAAEEAMAVRVVEACAALRSAGTHQ